MASFTEKKNTKFKLVNFYFIVKSDIKKEFEKKNL